MSRVVDLSDPDSLSLEDKLFVQDQGIMDFGLKVTDVYPDAPDPSGKDRALAPNTGSVNPVAPQVEITEVDESYDDWTKDQLQEELDNRSVEFTKSATKAELVELLEADDQEG